MYESNSVETQYLDYGSKTFSVMWGHADLFKRFTVLRGAVSRIRLPTISRVAQRQLCHDAIARHFGDNGGCGDRQGDGISFDNRAGRAGERWHPVAINQRKLRRRW